MLEFVPFRAYGRTEVNQAALHLPREQKVVQALPEGESVRRRVPPEGLIGGFDNLLRRGQGGHHIEQVVDAEEAEDRGAAEEVEAKREDEGGAGHRVEEVR